MSKLNIELFKKIRDRIEAIPESYNQSGFAIESTNSPCGTAACLAGEAIICAAPTVEAGVKRLWQMLDTDSKSVAREAARLLGLRGDFFEEDDEERDTRIFNACGSGWAEPYGQQFSDASHGFDYQARARVAVAYLDHIIATGSLE